MSRVRGAHRVVRRHRFTLIEIMVVLVIIGMVVGLAGPAVMNQFEKAKVKNASTQVKLLDNACSDYYLDMQEYPRSLEDLVSNPGNDKWDGPYLKPAKIPKDPWGEDFQYESPGQHGPVDIYSYGRDRSSGGEGRDADITNWE